MELERIRNPLLTAFMEDQIRNQGPSHITDLIIITIKSLIPSEREHGVKIDYRRYHEEIKLWKYYRHGQNSSLMNILGDIDSHIYWEHRDDTVLLRTLPIVLANEDYPVIRDEVIKNVLFSTGNIELLIEALLVAKLLHLILSGEKDVIDSLKQEIINFSQTGFMNSYRKGFRAPMEDYGGRFSIDFERYRIFALNTLNLSYTSQFQELQDCIGVYLDNLSGDSIIGKGIESCLKENDIDDIELDGCYKNLATYIYSLRKGRIDPKDLKIYDYDLPNIFQFDEGDIFYHSLLNRSKVVKKEITSNGLTVHLATKLGIYKLSK